MRALLLLLPAGLALMTGFNCEAANFDGTKPFLCATIDVASCAPGQDCARESAATVNSPQFFTVDVTKMLVSETGSGSAARTSKIDRVEHVSGLMLLAGADGVKGWVATIGEDSGKLSYAVIGDGLGIVAFGSCLIH